MAELQLTVSNGATTSQIPVASDTRLEDFLTVLIIEFGKPTHTLDNVCLLKAGSIVATGAKDLDKTVADVGLANNDKVMYMHRDESTKAAAQAALSKMMGSGMIKKSGGASSSSSAAAWSGSKTKLSNAEMQAQLANILKAIKVPSGNGSNGASSAISQQESASLAAARRAWQSMADPATKARMFTAARPLFDAYNKDPNDWEGFLAAWKVFEKEQLRKQQLMADGTSEEGQRLIQQQIEQNNIDRNYMNAMEESPENYIQVHMLYVNVSINGVPLKAFIDSGAQVSIMSLACARRCGLDRLIDGRFTGVARGVGGHQAFEGKIHACDVSVGDHAFSCMFDVMADREMDLLIGLNVLKRHRCSINLRTNKLEFGDIETPFLSDAEVAEHLKWLEEQSATSGPEAKFAVDAAKLAECVALGFSEEMANAALERSRNNLQIAVERLYAEQEAALNPAPMEQ